MEILILRSSHCMMAVVRLTCQRHYGQLNNSDSKTLAYQCRKRPPAFWSSTPVEYLPMPYNFPHLGERIPW